MTAPITLTYFTGSAVELSPAEASLYGRMDPVRQATNAAIRRFVDAHREVLGDRTLDYGAGKPGTCRIPQPFRQLIAAKTYIPWEPGDRVLAPAGVLFDAVLCTQVLQYVDEPQEVLNRFACLLRPGGWLVLTYPTAWEEIETEKWRFTEKGAWLLCHGAGFNVTVDVPLAQVVLDGCLTVTLVRGLVARMPI